MFSKRFLGFQTTLEAFEDSLNLSECTHQPFINNIHPTYICNILSVCLFISYYISLHLLISSVFVIRSNNYISSLGKPPKLKVDVQTLFSDGILMAIMVTYDANLIRASVMRLYEVVSRSQYFPMLFSSSQCLPSDCQVSS